MTGPLIAAKLVHFAAAFVLCGASLFGLYLGATAMSARRAFDLWLGKLLFWAAAVAFVSALAWWDSLAAVMGGEWSDALDPEILGAVLFETEFGRIWIARLVLAAILLGVLFLFTRHSPSKRTNWLIAVLAAALVLSLAPLGHAAQGDGIGVAMHLVARVLHLAAAAVWLGGLVPLGYLLAGAARTNDAGKVALVQQALPRFSLAGYIAVGLIPLSGCAIGWFHVDSPAALLGTPYGRVLLAKVGLFFLMVGVALFNRLILAPPILAGALQPIGRLWRSVAFEQALGLAVLAVASTLGTLPPAHGAG